MKQPNQRIVQTIPGEWGTELELAAAFEDNDAERRLLMIDNDAKMNLPVEHLGVVPREVSEHFLIAALRVDTRRIEVAMADPTLDSVVEELEFVTGKQVVRLEAPVDELRDAIDRAYAAVDEGARTKAKATQRRRTTSQAFLKAVVRPDYL